MCVGCERRRDCLRMMADYLTARTYSILEHRIKWLYGCMEESEPSTRVSGKRANHRTQCGSASNTRLVAQQFATALLQHSRSAKIQCDIVFEREQNRHWPCEPHPIRRDSSWVRVRFVEYVSSSCISAVVRDNSLHCTVRLFPMISVGYVPYIPSGTALNDNDILRTQCYSVTWPAKHEQQWLRDCLPTLNASLRYRDDDLSRKRVVFFLEGERHECRAGNAGCVEFGVAIPLEKFAV